MNVTKYDMTTTTLARVIVLYLQHASVLKRTARNNSLSLLKMLERVRGAPVKSETVPLTEINESLVLNYQTAVAAGHCEKAPKDEVSQREAKERALRSSRSAVIQARSIFSRRGEMDMIRVYEANGVMIPECVSGFMTCKLRGKPNKASYNVPADSTVEASLEQIELMKADLPVYLGFWLATGLGLRRKEIHYSKWEHVIEVNGRGWFQGGIGKDNLLIQVPFQSRAYEAILPYRKSEGWIIEERGDRWARRLSDWMRGQGWRTRLTLHELRAYSGSLIYARNPVAAMRFLRHKTLAVTERNYVRYGLHSEPIDVL